MRRCARREAPEMEIRRPANITAPAATNTTSAFQRTEVTASNAVVAAAEVSPEVARRAADGLLVNGSVNNAASSPFSQLPAFGNNRAPGKWPYNGNLGFILDNSHFDARPFSLTGQNTPRPAYTKITGLADARRPDPHSRPAAQRAAVHVDYQWTRNRNAATQSALVPTPPNAAGDFSRTLTPQGTPVEVIDPHDGPCRFRAIKFPSSRISPQARGAARALSAAEFQRAGALQLSGAHRQRPAPGQPCSSASVRQMGRKDNLIGTLQTQSTRTDDPNLFGFLATGRQCDASDATVELASQLQFALLREPGLSVQPQHLAQRAVFRQPRFNVSGAPGITGNNQEPLNWGPPVAQFRQRHRGAGRSAVLFHRAIRPRAFSVEIFRAHQRATTSPTVSISAASNGTRFRSRIRAAPSPSPEPRPARTSPGFLFGVPDTASIAFGNADKYFRANSWDAYISDDWRFASGLLAEARLALGIQLADHGTLRPAGESGRRRATSPRHTPVVARDAGR